MITRDIQIINRLGLHARAAASFVKQASAFESQIELCFGDQIVNGKSIMGIMMLAASQGSKLVLQVDGSDEEAASKTLVNLINDRFGEDE